VQGDTYNSIAPVLVPLLLQLEVDPFTRQAQDLLRGWDYSQPSSSAAAAYFNAVWATLLDLTFADEMPEGTWPDGGSRWFSVVRQLLDRPKDPWWDDRRTPNIVETRDEILRQSLVQARLRLTSSLGKDPGHWRWGRLHRLTLTQSPLGGPTSLPPLRWLLDRGPYELGGGPAAVDDFAWDASSGDFDVVAGPSMRMVVDLDNLDHSLWVNQTGNSGHPADSHYDDQINAWLRGDLQPWPFSERAVRIATRDELRLVPGN
jgi:penicillin amidase